MLAHMTASTGALTAAREESEDATRSTALFIALAVVLGAGALGAGGWLLRWSIRGAVRTLVGEAGRLGEAVAAGRLDERADPKAAGLDFVPVVEALNRSVDAFVGPLRLLARN